MLDRLKKCPPLFFLAVGQGCGLEGIQYASEQPGGDRTGMGRQDSAAAGDGPRFFRGPVSYTHLDVYKRQGPAAERAFPALSYNSLSCCSFDMSGNFYEPSEKG